MKFTSVISSARKRYFFSFSAEDKEASDVDYHKEEDEEDAGGGGGGVGLKMEKGQKLTQRQLQMLETIAEEKGDSKNPLCCRDCKEYQETVRCLKRRQRNKMI